MSDVAALIADLVRAGVDPDLIGRTAAALASREPVKVVDEQAERRRAADRERKRLRNSADSADAVSPKKEIPHTPLEKTTPSTVSEPVGSSTKTRANDLAEFRSECADLDDERLAALIKHRRAKNGQITGHAARLFRRDADACGLSLAEAVDTCVSRNWITVKPEYLSGRKQTATAPPGPNRKRNFVDVARDRFAGQDDGSADVFGNHGNVERLPSRLLGS